MLENMLDFIWLLFVQFYISKISFILIIPNLWNNHEKKILVCTISSHDFVNEPAFNFGVGDLMRVDEMNSLAQY